MPTKGRLKDTFDHLYERAKSHPSWLMKGDIDALKEWVEQYDAIGKGKSLSLGWSWYNSRPSKNLRQAIRAHVMISLYSGDINVGNIKTLENRLKSSSEKTIYTELKTNIKKLIKTPAIWTQAVEFTQNIAGGGSARASANSVQSTTTVPHVMGAIKEKNPGIAVMIIDMQSSDGLDVSADKFSKKFYDGKSIIDHMTDVLKAAKHLGLIVYDVVIDKDGLNGRIRTINSLAREMPQSDSKHKRIAKPYYNTFLDTPLEGMLKKDKINTLVVMGFDGNICVMNTIFGTPSYKEAISEREMTLAEKKELCKTRYPGIDPTKTAKSQKIPESAFKSMFMKVETKDIDYTRGLLERGIKVITSRSILATGSDAKLVENWGILSGQ